MCVCARDESIIKHLTDVTVFANTHAQHSQNLSVNCPDDIYTGDVTISSCEFDKQFDNRKKTVKKTRISSTAHDLSATRTTPRQPTPNP